MKKFSKTGIVLVGCMLVCVILALAVGVPNGFFGSGGEGGDLDDEDTPGIQEVVEGSTPLFIFDKRESTQKLMQDFDNGEVASVSLMYDQMGANEEITSEDPAIIKKAYKALKNIVVLEATGESITDAYHYVYFTLSDGTNVCFSFEGENLMNYDDGNGGKEDGNYEVQNTQGLWTLYNNLADKQ